MGSKNRSLCYPEKQIEGRELLDLQRCLASAHRQAVDYPLNVPSFFWDAEGVYVVRSYGEEGVRSYGE